ncbi:MAG: hypothetical protein D6743_16755, partial [Calditrichaeota bacterium]
HYPIEISTDPAEITTSEPLVSLTATLVSTLDYPVTLQRRTIRVRKGDQFMPKPGSGATLPGMKTGEMKEILAYGSLDVLPANGSYSDRANIPLNLDWLLAGKEEAKCAAEITYIAQDAAGKTVLGRVFVPINITKTGKRKPGQLADSDKLPTTTDKYILIPKVAEVRAIQQLTSVSVQGSNHVLNGPVQLTLIPSPFDQKKIVVQASNLTFAPQPGQTRTWEVKAGGFSEEATAVKKELLSVYKNFLKIQKISYDFTRSDKLLVDRAVGEVPVLGKKVYFKNLVINENGLEMKVAEQELSAFGLTFRVTDIQKQSGAAGDVISLGVGLRVKGKPKSEEFVTTRLVIRDINGKKSVQMKAVPGKPVRLIPKTDYFDLNSFEFKEKANDNWVLAVEVSTEGLLFFRKLGPITGMVEYERSGKIVGKLELLKETTPGYK